MVPEPEVEDNTVTKYSKTMKAEIFSKMMLDRKLDKFAKILISKFKEYANNKQRCAKRHQGKSSSRFPPILIFIQFKKDQVLQSVKGPSLIV